MLDLSEHRQECHVKLRVKTSSAVPTPTANPKEMKRFVSAKKVGLSFHLTSLKDVSISMNATSLTAHQACVE